MTAEFEAEMARSFRMVSKLGKPHICRLDGNWSVVMPNGIFKIAQRFETIATFAKNERRAPLRLVK